MRVFISTWGDPSGWSRVNYLKDSGKSVESFTSLSAYENYDRILLLVQDSILVPQGWDKNKNTYRNADIAICINNMQQTVLNPPSYKDWLDSVDKYVLCAIQKANIDPAKVSIIKVPSVGQFRGTFAGNVQVTYNFGLLKVRQNQVTSLPLSYLESLLAYNIYTELKKLGNVREVVLDITHGINYFASLALMVVMNLASLLKFKLEVINFIPTEIGKTYTYKKVFSLSDSKFDLSRIENIKDEAKKGLILSLKMGALLPILYICKNAKRQTADYNSLFIENTRIEPGSTFSVVVTKGIDELRESDEVWSDIVFEHVCEKVKNIKDQDGYYSLEDIHSMKNGLSNLFSDTTVSIMDDQLNDIESAAKSLNVGEEKMLYCISLGKRETADEMLKSIDVTKRNFIAHAGFLKEIVKVKRANEVLVKYHFEDEKYYEVLRKIYSVDVKKFLQA